MPGEHACIWRDHEYVRHGTMMLMAGIDLLSGKVHGIVVDRHRSREFISFLRELGRSYPPAARLRLVLDNHSAHISKETRTYLATIPNRFEFIFTPKHGSWLNLVESFFGKIARTMLRGIRVSSKAELKDRILQYLAEVNASPVVYRWKYKVESVSLLGLGCNAMMESFLVYIFCVEFRYICSLTEFWRHTAVRYGIAIGNHDMTADGDSSLFQRCFPAEHFNRFAWYGGIYGGPKPGISGNNANSWQRFSAAGLDFVFLHLECNAPDDVLEWTDGVLRGNADRRAIVTTHMGLGPVELPKVERDFHDAPKGRMRWSKRHGKRGNSPQQMWDKCFRKHPNVGLIYYGDQSRTQALRQVSLNDHGKPVHELLSDYHQNWLRANRFLPDADRIQVYSTDSRNGALCRGTKIQPDPGQHQFVLQYEMSGAGRR
ncbi:MAG: IS630 family transposase [Acidobacteria bacterium]|nr:IS630 family transposase [Acidobacteriota bacterium]